MRWVAIFVDRPDALDVRKAQAEAHFAYLEANRHQIRMAGGLRDAESDPPSGGLWILDNISGRAEAERLCEDDPFYAAGLRQSYTLHAWGYAPCFADVEI